ncbi:hypothetical protein [Borrelia miyamotoi]|uniref:hypothetical protein n=1 Tax=Borrelia miyamotoi TaxID=47466 RepID=UPI0023B77DBC|nr:hypothetical protein [Borrelia miyamotoi]
MKTQEERHVLIKAKIVNLIQRAKTKALMSKLRVWETMVRIRSNYHYDFLKGVQKQIKVANKLVKVFGLKIVLFTNNAK